MQKIVIDTNVFVSSLIQRSYPYRIIYELFIEDKFQLCISPALLVEYYDVLARPKFAKYPDFIVKAEMLLVDIEIKSIKYDPQIKLDVVSDLDDNKIIELADESSADFIITGNTSDFTFQTYKKTRIVTPKEYWENHQAV
ncbi:MAG: putative toxin-antitoxin system toxin component, PIN family [Bacteroidota bacterium]|nr:putative toxin-antitoxin system toxin component, PIN family [Bacteroidota bacterium]